GGVEVAAAGVGVAAVVVGRRIAAVPHQYRRVIRHGGVEVAPLNVRVGPIVVGGDVVRRQLDRAREVINGGRVVAALGEDVAAVVEEDRELGPEQGRLVQVCQGQVQFAAVAVAVAT